MIRPKRVALFEDDRGAMMAMALFLAIFLVGSLYLILGVGDSVLYRRVMQDGADAGAFAAAVMAAKGMNLHVVLNVAMTITAGILLVLRSVEVMLEIIIAILEAMTASIALAPKALPLIAVVAPAEATVERIGDSVEQFVRVSHNALDAAHHAVQRGYPLLADVRAVDLMVRSDTYDPPLIAGFVVPTLGAELPSGGSGLPVEKQDIGVLCDRAAAAVGDRLRDVGSGTPRWLGRFLGGAAEKALRLGRRRTCDSDVVESPRSVIIRRKDDSEVWLGHEEFQYRAYGFGRDPGDQRWQTAEHGLRVAQGGRDEGRDAAYHLHTLGRLGFAQAEYYFDGVQDRSEWLWKQKWRARLRRFRVTKRLLPSGMRAACFSARGIAPGEQTAGFCDTVRDFSLNSISAH
jgi:hypothetical protein